MTESPEIQNSIFNIFHPENIVAIGGLALLLLVIFVETGFFFGFFLPGDSLLFVSGIFCESKYINIPVWFLIILVIIAVVAGTSVGYGFGRFTRGYLERKPENLFYRQSYLTITTRFFERYGMVTFIIGRFLPVVRTFSPILAGISKVDFIKFLAYNLVGAILWVTPLIAIGYWLGGKFPSITDHISWVVGTMIVLTAIPLVFITIKKKNEKNY